MALKRLVLEVIFITDSFIFPAKSGSLAFKNVTIGIFIFCLLALLTFSFLQLAIELFVVCRFYFAVLLLPLLAVFWTLCVIDFSLAATLGAIFGSHAQNLLKYFTGFCLLQIHTTHTHTSTLAVFSDFCCCAAFFAQSEILFSFLLTKFFTLLSSEAAAAFLRWFNLSRSFF